jgi:hypothetical protein
VLAALTVVPACSSDGKDQDQGVRRGEPLTWTKVDLPAGDQPVRLMPMGDRLLVGVRHPGARTVPRLLVRSADGGLTPVPLTPKTPYAYEAVWLSLATDGSRLVAIGGAPGGAHSNTRWTVWTGTTAGLVEQPQGFNTFGGWGAGNLVDAVTTTAGSVLIGSWGSDKAGLDAAAWLPSGAKWVRQSSAGTALESTKTLLVSARSASPAGPAIVLAGSEVKLGDGSVRQQAALWRSATLDKGWSRLELPDPGDRSEAIGARCSSPASCAVNGYADGKLALWKVDGGTASRLGGLPDIDVGDKDVLPAPIDAGDGRLVQLAGNDGKVEVVSGSGDNWTVQDSTGPTGAVIDAVRVGTEVFVLAGPPGGAASLWKADLSAVH